MPTALELVNALLDDDAVARSLGITLGAVEAGRVEIRMPVAAAMVNGHGLVHGGYLFLLADTALAFCCASLDKPSVTRTADIAFLAPAREHDTLVATAAVRADAGRATIIDVRITSGETVLAEFRGHGAATR